MKHLPSIFLLFVSLLGTQGWGIILYSGSNSDNLTAPDTAREDIFNSVGRVAGGNRGSVVHIRGKYLLTANHVNTNTNLVTFDGITNWQIDTAFTPVQIGTADMKLIKLVEDPGLPETQLYDISVGDTVVNATLIGWGVGRDPDIADTGFGNTNIWAWGNTTTMAKRWGTNIIEAASSGPVTAGYTYDHLITYLSRNSGNNEAAATLYDSGSGLFIQSGGTWKLAGLTTAVETPNSSTFSYIGDRNFFARISSYASQIESAIPDTTTYEGWKVDYSVTGSEDSDGDADGVQLLLEFAFNGDPTENDNSVLPQFQMTEDSGNQYLELAYTRPVANDLIYTPKTTTDLESWPADSTGVNAESIVINGDGTETVVHRRTLPVSGTPKAFLRVDVELAP